jgi:hypothetical protein
MVKKSIIFLICCSSWLSSFAFVSTDVGREILALQTKTGRGLVEGNVYVITEVINAEQAQHTGGGAGIRSSAEGLQWEFYVFVDPNAPDFSNAGTVVYEGIQPLIYGDPITRGRTGGILFETSTHVRIAWGANSSDEQSYLKTSEGILWSYDIFPVNEQTLGDALRNSIYHMTDANGDLIDGLVGSFLSSQTSSMGINTFVTIQWNLTEYGNTVIHVDLLGNLGEPNAVIASTTQLTGGGGGDDADTGHDSDGDGTTDSTDDNTDNDSSTGGGDNSDSDDSTDDSSDETGNVDSDNDVPTLQLILAELNYLDRDNDGTNLIAIQDSLQSILARQDSDDDVPTLNNILQSLENIRTQNRDTDNDAENLQAILASINELKSALNITVDVNQTVDGNQSYTYLMDGIDSDNDVPMLQNIYQRLASLDQDNDFQNLENIWNRQADVAGQIQEINSTVVRMTTLADLEYSLRKIQTKLDLNETRGYINDLNKTAQISDIYNKLSNLQGFITEENRTATLADIYYALVGEEETDDLNLSVSPNITSSIEETFDDLQDRALAHVNKIKSIPTTGGQNLSTLFEMSAGNHDFYVDPLNNIVSGDNVSFGATFSQIASWISLVIGLSCVVVYYIAQTENIHEFLKVIMIAPTSAPVTTIPLIIVKVTLMGVLFGTTIYGAMTAIWDSNFTVLGVTGGAIDIVSNGLTLLTGQSTWGSMALSLFFELVPIDTITTLFVLYYGGKLFMSFVMASGFTLIRVST